MVSLGFFRFGKGFLALWQFYITNQVRWLGYNRCMDIWTFQRRVSQRLFLWSGLSIFIGLGLLFVKDNFWTGFASQAIVWGLIDAGIAVFGQRGAQKRRAKLSPRNPRLVEANETRTLRRTLQVNAVLDLVYVAVGLWLALARAESLLQGVGWGVIVQGIFLFVFDLTHIFLTPKK